MNTHSLPRSLSAVCFVSLLLSACGGGGSSSSSAANQGTLNVAVTDGPGEGYSHAWVTIKAISFHTDPNAVWSASDASWKKYTLPAPVTVDLANLTNGALNQVFSNITFPAGSYKQMRLFLAGYDAALTSSAQSAGLLYNDQVVYTDSNNVVHNVPLEVAYPTQGMQLLGSFTLAAAGTLNLAIDFDLEHDLAPFLHGDVGNQQIFYTLKPNLRYFDLDQAGAITGTIDPSVLCVNGNTTNCGYNVLVKAEAVSADGTRHYDLRATTLAANGSFSLYPLPAGQNYDILIRGRGLETMLVQGVPAPLGSTPVESQSILQSTAITPPLDGTGEYFANVSGPLNPASGWLDFQQTLPGAGSLPYEVRWANTNPYTGVLRTPIALANGPIYVAPYNNGSALNFTPTTPQEGLGSYSAIANGVAYYAVSAPAAVASPGSNTVGSPLTFAANNPTLAAGVVNGTVTGTISLLTAGEYDKGYLVLSRFANIVNTVDISGILTANSGTGGSYQVNLPAGTANAPVPGAYYYAYLRVWKTGQASKWKTIPINGFIDLRTSSSVSAFNVSLP